MANYIILISVFLLSGCSSVTNNGVVDNLSETKECTENKLFGEWVFINMYEGILNNIDTLNKAVLRSNNGFITLTYKETGIYTNNQGDYTTEGKFTLNTKNCIIKEFDNNGGDTLTLKIKYLDNHYLLVTKGDAYSYFYKRK